MLFSSQQVAAGGRIPLLPQLRPDDGNEERGGQVDPGCRTAQQLFIHQQLQPAHSDTVGIKAPLPAFTRAAAATDLGPGLLWTVGPLGMGGWDGIPIGGTATADG